VRSRPPWWRQAVERSLLVSSRVRTSCQDDPSRPVSGESQVDEPPEVEGGDAEPQPGVVGFDASVGDAPVGSSHEPGDGAFDHGSPPLIVLGEVTVAPGSAPLDQVSVMGSNLDRPAVFGGGAASSQGTRPASGAEYRIALDDDGDDVAGGTDSSAGIGTALPVC